MELHEFLDQWRAGRGWTIQRFADELDVSQSLVSKWLHPEPRRRVRPNRETLRRIAGLVGVPNLDLMRMAGYVEEGDLVEGTGPLDPDLVLVQAAWPRLDAGLKRAIKLIAGGGGRLTRCQFGVPVLAGT